MDYSTVRSLSCCILKKKIWFYTTLGDLFELDLLTKKLQLIRNTKKYEKIPSVFEIFKVGDSFYHIEINWLY